MEAKDTGLTHHQIYQFAIRIENEFGIDEHPITRHAKVEQLIREIAEISSKAGIKKVVEWIEENYGLDNYGCYGIPQKVLQAQFKEWGI